MQKYFFEAPKGKAHQELWKQFRFLRQPYTSLHQEWINYARHYNHRQWSRGLVTSLNFDFQMQQGSANKVTLNIVKNVIDTVHSKITKHQPDLSVMAALHDASAEAASDYATKFLRERFRTLKLNQAQVEGYLDACIYGTGPLLVWFNRHLRVGGKQIGEIEVKRLLPYSVFVDTEMLGNQEPNWVIILEFLHIKELEANYPKVNFSAEIGKSEFPNRLNASGKQTEYIPVLRMFHKKTEYMKKGRHLLCTENATLEDEDFDYDELPVKFQHYSKGPSAFWGVGLGRVLRSIQIEINKILFHIAQNQNLFGRPKLWVPTGANIPTEMLANGPGIIEGDQRPEYITPEPTPKEVFDTLKFYVEQAYQISGISLATATGEPPPAVRSALAMEHMAERENDRFALSLMNYEQFKVDLAKWVLTLSKKNYKKGEARVFKAVADSEHYEQIEFDDLKLDELEDHINVVTVNSLGHTKAGQLEFLMQIVQMGLIKDPAQIMDLMRIPNEDKTFDSVILDVKVARQENIRMSRGEEIEPSEFEDQTAHIKEHIVDIKSNKFSNESEEVKKLKADHLHKHFALVQASQQQAQQQQLQQMQQQAQAQAQAQAMANPQQQQQPQATPAAGSDQQVA